MATGLTKTKKRIASVKSIEKITKAMEMVATVKLKKMRSSHEGGTLYQQGYEDLMGELFLQKDTQSCIYSKTHHHAKHRHLFIVVTSDLGLCGSYNTNIYKWIDEHVKINRDYIFPIGEKGIAHFTRDPKYHHVTTDELPLDSKLDHRDIHVTAEKIIELFESGEFNRIYLLYTRYENSITFTPRRFQLLPVQLHHQAHPKEKYAPPLCEPMPLQMIKDSIAIYLSSSLRGKISEAQLSEQGARRNAMEAADDNAEELIDKLSIEYNKARQAAITTEITEVIAGAQ